MKKLFVILLVTAMFLGAFAVQPAAAFTGAQGTVIDNEGNPWTHGGAVTLYAEVGSNYQAVGTGSIDTTTGVFNVAYTDTPDSFTTVYLLIEYNAGPGGEPGTTVIDYTELTSNQRYNAGYVETGTGPTAITLQGVTAADSGAPALFATVGVLLLAGASVLLWRRRAIA